MKETPPGYLSPVEKEMLGLPPSEEEKAAVKLSTGDIARKAGESFVKGFVSDATLGLSEATGLAPFKLPEQVHWTQAPAEGAGRFLGFVLGAPVKLGSMTARLLLKPLGRPLEKVAGKFAGRVAGNLAQKALGLGVASAVSDVTNIKGMPKRFLSGTAMGAIFGGAEWVNFRKAAPFLSQIARQSLTRALSAPMGLYNNEGIHGLIKGIAEGKVDPKHAQTVFDELLFTWFSRKPINPNELFADLKKIEAEVKKNKWPLKVWTPYETPEYAKTMEKIPARFVVTGSGEAIPVELFSRQPKISDLLKVAPQLQKPPEMLPEHKPVPPKKTRPALTREIETKLARGEELAPEEKTALAQSGMYEELKPGIAEGAIESKLTEDLKLTPTPDKPESINKFYSGIHIPDMLKSLDKVLEKKYGMATEPADNIAKKDIKEAKETVDDPERSIKFGARAFKNFERLGPSGKRLADISIRYIKDRAQMEQRAIFELYGAAKMVAKGVPERNPLKKTRITGEKLFDFLEGKATPKTPAEIQAKETLEKQMRNIAKMAEELNIRIITPLGEREWKPIENYAPVVWKRNGLRRFLEDKSFRHLRGMYKERIAAKNWPELYESDPPKALEMAEKYFEQIRNDLKTRSAGHLEHPRILTDKMLEELKVEWEKRYPGEKFPLERDKSVGALAKYLISSYERLAWLKNFGKDVNMGKGAYMPARVADLYYKFEDQASRRYVMNFFRRYLRQGDALDTKTTKWLRNIRTYQLTKLAFAFIPNSTQWLTNTVSMIDSKPAVEALWDAIKYSGLAGKKLKERQRDFFSKTGASTFKHAFQQAMMEDPGKISTVADAMMRFHLFSGTEFFNALFSASAGARQAIRLSEKLYRGRGKSWRSPFYRAELKKLGLSEKDVEYIIENGPLTEKDVRKLADAAFHMRRYTQFLSDAFHLPSTWSTPTGRLLTQFKNFSYNQTALIYNEGIKEAAKFLRSGGREGSITKLGKMMVLIPLAGYLVTKFKEQLYPKLGIHFYEELLAGKSWPFKVMMYTMNAGGLGIATDIFMAAGFGKAGLVGLLGGPTTSDLAEFWEALSKSKNEIWTAIKHTNAKYLKHRGKTIRDYWLRVGERLSPDARIAIQNFFKDYKGLKSATNWSRLVQDVYREYKELYKLKSPKAADEFWKAFMQTQGKEYQEVFGKIPKKPTPKEIEQWWEELGKSSRERMTMPGKEPSKKKVFGDWWY
ncbi:MAG: hypothetical protein JRI41_06775 [Deltaproteobacteria bacterium]|nr:hypothetical protein [Deltaproteobacteria bacterium]